jgi:hypothetical protein
MEGMALRRSRMFSLTRFAMAVAAIFSSAAALAADSWFDDIERYTNLREIRLDIAGPESASFTALRVAPFLTAQALATSDMSFSAAQVFDDYGNPRAALGVDFAPTLLRKSAVTLKDYQRSHAQRIVSRLQLSVAVTKGESANDRSTRVAPTLRIVFHEERDPRVHRGPGSLEDCFERTVKPPENLRGKFTTEDDYRAALREIAREGMEQCRDDPEVAAYTWNASGIALGVSPSFRDDLDDLGSLKSKGVVLFATQSFGFDRQGRRSTYVPSFLGAHAQVLTQVLYRVNEPLINPLRQGSVVDADELVGSVRLRAGSSRLAGNIEAAVIHDWFPGQQNDTLTRIAVGLDAHLARGVWLSLSLGRTLWRDVIPNQTSGGLSLKWTMLN